MWRASAEDRLAEWMARMVNLDELASMAPDPLILKVTP
jgi:hypothetical protein